MREFVKSALLKRKQLEQEINNSNATPNEKKDMQHTLSKLWMFASEEFDTINNRVPKSALEAEYQRGFVDGDLNREDD
jgi:hypothetical protein